MKQPRTSSARCAARLSFAPPARKPSRNTQRTNIAKPSRTAFPASSRPSKQTEAESLVVVPFRFPLFLQAFRPPTRLCPNLNILHIYTFVHSSTLSMYTNWSPLYL
ncbi:hypothetical protein BC937DRAFT_86686 [Endogone sp. FLAS-F59071]|nr:hypothetical protein BC937DRAFT_86686 [Endogone sp. FLAS-F59071]|eukprot:RUS12927.1 hypothetical protein BC937DRAFT_86686 [Endogone sp. FLAS-F59071]